MQLSVVVSALLVPTVVAVGGPAQAATPGPSTLPPPTSVAPPTDSTLPPTDSTRPPAGDNVISVGSIDVTTKKGFTVATVTIVDSDGNPVEGARVKGSWGGWSEGSSSKKTNADGVAKMGRGFVQPDLAGEQTAYFSVDYVRAKGYEWDGVVDSAQISPVEATVTIKVRHVYGQTTLLFRVVDENGVRVPYADISGTWEGEGEVGSFELQANRKGRAKIRENNIAVPQEFDLTSVDLPLGYEWDGNWTIIDETGD